MNDSIATQQDPPKLRRVLGLWDLVLFGIILIQPIPSLGQFGIGSELSHGHMVTALLVAMVAMLFTAVSYGRLSAVYPSAGSAYAYVGRGLNAHVGFLVGWAMFLGYLVIPLVNVVYAAVTCRRMFEHTFLRGTPYVVWLVLLVLAITMLNLRGLRSTARFNIALMVAMSAFVLVYIALALRFLCHGQGWPGLFSFTPFYDPQTFDFQAIRAGTAFVALTYIGVDGITTLAEDVRNPKRNVMLATILVCVFTGVFSGFQIYLAQRVWPDYKTFPNLETAIFDVCQRIGGPLLFDALAVTLLIASIGSGLAGQASGARLLYGMGRDGVLPRRFFGHLDAKGKCPILNLWLIATLTIAAALFFNYEKAGKLLVFGSFLAFIWVNLAAISVFYFRAARGERSVLRDVLPPALGVVFCSLIWAALDKATMISGFIWMLIGLVYLGMATAGFSKQPPQIDFSEG
jgi:amino acid transporter